MSATSIPADINRKHLEMARQQISKDRKSTRLNSSHLVISYAVFCLKKKKQIVPAPYLSRHAADVAPPWPGRLSPRSAPRSAVLSCAGHRVRERLISP